LKGSTEVTEERDEQRMPSGIIDMIGTPDQIAEQLMQAMLMPVIKAMHDNSQADAANCVANLTVKCIAMLATYVGEDNTREVVEDGIRAFKQFSVLSQLPTNHPGQ
jgi:hypothetical protein